MNRLLLQTRSALPHVTAACAALLYAWWVSGTVLFNTGLQFVAPLAVVIGVHLIWFAGQGHLQLGFARRIYGKALGTAVFMVSALILGSLFAPQPAYADTGESLGVILVLVFCAAVIAAVVWLLMFVLNLIANVVEMGVKAIKSKDDDEPPQSRMFDVGSLVLCCMLIAVGSLEGLPNGYSFNGQGKARAAVLVDAPPQDVWQAMQTATSPDFPVPAMLGLFPRPVAVSVDEGVVLGANRVVDFSGREGAGALHLRVVSATATTVVFDVISDTTPYAGWIGYQQLTYHIVPDEAGTALSVSLTFDRKLAPAWFFDPVMKGASYLAVDVLARDVKARSEG